MKNLSFSLAFLFTLAIGCPAADDIKALTDGNNRFAIELYHALSSQDGNLFLSPFSISSALAMTYAGTGGSTADEMAKTLRADHPFLFLIRDNASGAILFLGRLSDPTR